MAKLKARTLGQPPCIDPDNYRIFWLMPALHTKGPSKGKAKDLSNGAAALCVRATEDVEGWRGWVVDSGQVQQTDWPRTLWQSVPEPAVPSAETGSAEKKGDTLPSPPMNPKTSPLSNGQHQPPLGGSAAGL